MKSNITLIIALIALALGLFANYQSMRIVNGVQSEKFLQIHSGTLDQQVDTRIELYVQRQKRKLVEEKYEGYELAAEEIDSGKTLYGAEAARFTLVEYSDIECPYCKRFHKTPKKVVDGSKGNVNWEFKHFPLANHNPMALVEATAAECAEEIGGNKAFWVYLDQLFEETKGNGQGAGDLVQLAKDIGLDSAKFDKCISSGKYREQVASEMKHGASVGVDSTPATFIVDNLTGQSTMLRGAQSEQAILSVINRMIKQPAAPQAAQEGSL